MTVERLPIRWHTNPRTCPHMNDHVCPTCDFDRYYERSYPDCPWTKEPA